MHPGPAPRGSRLSRLFAAVDGSEAAYDAIAAALPTADTPGAPRWMDRAMWHLTVAFIGPFPDEPLRPGLAEIAATRARFTLRFAGSGVFPGRTKPRVLWAGVAGELDALHDLASAVRAAATAVGADPDARPYRPHLTLGMWRPGRPADPDCAPGLADHTGPEFTVSALTLFRSDGGWYEPLARYALAAAPHQA